jgi:putative ABC transport system substrate-binding protein
LDRRSAIVALGVFASSVVRQVLAQSGRIHRIGLLWIKAESESNAYVQAFREGLRAQGYVEGRNIEIDDHFLVDRYPLLPDAAAKLSTAKVDVILSYGSTATTAAARASTTIPIVAITGSDPVAARYAESLARPGKNITGIAMVTAELGLKRLQLLKQLVPGVRVVGVPFNPESVREEAGFKKLESEGRNLGLELRAVMVRLPQDMDSAIQNAAKMGVGAFAPSPSTMFAANARLLTDAIRKTNLPAIYVIDDFSRVGGLLSYGPSFREAFRHAAVFVDKILKGAKPAELAFEQPTKFDLIVNLKTAKALGLTVPKELLLRADEVIE